MAIQVSGTTVIDNSRNIINVATGSSTAPSISPTSDTNTGVYFPIADNLSFATGGELRVNIGSTGIVSFTGSITEFYQGQYWNVVTQADVGYGASQVPLNQYLGQLAFLDDYHPNGLRRDGGGSDDVFVTSDGRVGIGTTNPTEKLTVGGNILINDTTLHGSITATTSTTSTVGIHSALPIATYRSVEYTIQVTEGSNFHATKILALHDGSTAYNSEYGILYNNTSVSGFSVDISGGNIRLLATPASSSTTNYTINFIATKI